MPRSNDRQLELSLRIPTAAERKAVVRDRLVGFEYRQAAREARRRKRREAVRRRKAGALLAGQGSAVAGEARQLTLPDVPSR